MFTCFGWAMVGFTWVTPTIRFGVMLSMHEGKGHEQSGFSVQARSSLWRSTLTVLPPRGANARSKAGHAPRNWRWPPGIRACCMIWRVSCPSPRPA
jgi:hypothetical protein